jgi:hypothetical protein
VYCSHTALDQFRYGPGSVTSQLLAENRGRLRASKKKAKVGDRHRVVGSRNGESESR